MALSSGATTLKRMSLSDLTRAAQWVVRARCLDTQSSGKSSGLGADIWTVTDFDVEESWKGQPSARVQVWLPGGRAGHVIRLVPGAPRFRAGEEVVLFLERTRDGDWSITAWGEGTFRIRRNTSGDEIATPDVASGDSSNESSSPTAPRPVEAMSVAELKTQVRQAALSPGNSR